MSLIGALEGEEQQRGAAEGAEEADDAEVLQGDVVGELVDAVGDGADALGVGDEDAGDAVEEVAGGVLAEAADEGEDQAGEGDDREDGLEGEARGEGGGAVDLDPPAHGVDEDEPGLARAADVALGDAGDEPNRAAGGRRRPRTSGRASADERCGGALAVAGAGRRACRARDFSAGRGLRGVDQIVEQREQGLAGGADLGDVVGEVVELEGLEVLAEQFAVADDRVERAADLAVDVGEELGDWASRARSISLVRCSTASARRSLIRTSSRLAARSWPSSASIAAPAR
jgi:hypothetical protein